VDAGGAKGSLVAFTTTAARKGKESQKDRKKRLQTEAEAGQASPLRAAPVAWGTTASSAAGVGDAAETGAVKDRAGVSLLGIIQEESKKPKKAVEPAAVQEGRAWGWINPVAGGEDASLRDILAQEETAIVQLEEQRAQEEAEAAVRRLEEKEEAAKKKHDADKARKKAEGKKVADAKRAAAGKQKKAGGKGGKVGTGKEDSKAKGGAKKSDREASQAKPLPSPKQAGKGGKGKSATKSGKGPKGDGGRKKPPPGQQQPVAGAQPPRGLDPAAAAYEYTPP